ncbi:MAG: cheY [Anaerocolumna sp.]|jgi:two-component system chemotaxis response regulator CheY|nr:cheY [Anaerocolumna sp.]
MANILLVDDSAFMRKMEGDVITKNGHVIVGEAGNGKEAIDMYQKLLPDLVIMDITMPELNGVEAVKVIKTLDPKAKIIMLSAMGQDYMVIEAISSGASDFIVKPFQDEKFIKSINNVLEAD